MDMQDASQSPQICGKGLRGDKGLGLSLPGCIATPNEQVVPALQRHEGPTGPATPYARAAPCRPSSRCVVHRSDSPSIDVVLMFGPEEQPRSLSLSLSLSLSGCGLIRRLVPCGCHDFAGEVLFGAQVPGCNSPSRG